MSAEPAANLHSDQFPIPDNVFAQTVTDVEHYTDRLFRFRTTRPDAFRFSSGQFVMIGLPGDERPIYRAYSIASPGWDEELEFFSIKVDGGPLTARLQKIKVGDAILVKKKPTGTLVNDALLPGNRLWMFATGTGIAPFASLIRDPATYDKFNHVVLTHTCRDTAELRYSQDLVAALKADPLVGELAASLRLYITTTREPSDTMGRITDLLKSGKIYSDLNLSQITPENDRAMICGSKDMIADTTTIMQQAGFTAGSNSRPGTFVVERAFVD